ncbi:MAG: glycosyltransferase [Patescibacteria group bacterium]
MKNILVVNTSPEINKPLNEIFKELLNKGYSFYFLTSQPEFLNEIIKEKWPVKKVNFGPDINKRQNLIFFIILLPIFFLYYFYFLLLIRKKQNIETIILMNWNEKIIISPLARILKLKIIWLEEPQITYKSKPALLLKLYKIAARSVHLVSFIDFTAWQLKSIGINKKQIISIPLGIRLNHYTRQENIFSSIVKSGQTKFSQKYFTIGTVVDIRRASLIENLFQVGKTCLTVIPNLQIIVVAEGGRKDSLAEPMKKLNWLAKKMEINNIVWFVSEPAENSPIVQLRKWLDSFNIFVITCPEAKLNDLAITLKVMAAGLPIIGPRNAGFEDLIIDKQTGILIEANNNEVLARQIISLYKDKRLQKNLASKAEEKVKNNFQLEMSVKKFEHILNK